MNTENSKSEWSRKYILLLIATALAMIASAMAQNKLAPIVNALMEYWGLQEGMIGILQSSQSWIVVFVLIPVGACMSRVSLRLVGGLALGMMALGNLVGLLAPSYAFLVAGRILEGLGCILIDVMCQTIIAINFKINRGLALGIVNCCNMIGQVIYLNVAPSIITLQGWKGIYLAMIILEVVVLLVWITIINKQYNAQPSTAAAKPAEKGAKTASHSLGYRLRFLKCKELWLIAVAGGIYCMCGPLFNTYVPSFLVSRGLAEATASRISSLSPLFGMISMLAFGALADRFRSRRKVAIFCFVFTGLSFLLLQLPVTYAVIFIVANGLFPRTLIPTTYSAVPDIVDPELISVSNSFIKTMCQVFQIVCSILVGFLIQTAGYTVTIYVMAVCMVLGGVLWLSAKKIK